MSSQYVYDDNHIEFRHHSRSVGGILLKCLKYFLITLSLAAFYYVIFALFIDTDTEKKLRTQIRMYEELYPALAERQSLVSDVISGLQDRDGIIYKSIFNTEAPTRELVGLNGFFAASDTIPDKDILEYANRRLERLGEGVESVEENFAHIMAKISEGVQLPPLSMPIEGVGYSQTGASVGKKLNPFYKVPAQHDGIDLVAPVGTGVMAAADGVVKDIIRSRKGLGNTVEIDHGNGYVTRYAQLSEITVSKGQKVAKGRKIGEAGMSGNSFAPHLHYEVRLDGEPRDPVDYFFASVSPDEYMDMMIMSLSVGQSMD